MADWIKLERNVEPRGVIFLDLEDVSSITFEKTKAGCFQASFEKKSGGFSSIEFGGDKEYNEYLDAFAKKLGGK